MARAGAGSGRSSVFVAAGIAVSRLTGFARERAIGHYFGTGPVTDAFTAAFRIPNLLQHLLGEGVLSATFIPVHARLLAEGREREAGRLAGAMLGLLAAVVSAICVVGMLLAEPITSIVAAGLRDRPETFDLTVRLVRLLFPAVGLLVMSAWCLGILNSHRRFFLSYVAPAAFNICQVAAVVGAGALLFADRPLVDETSIGSQESLVMWLAIGTIAGGVAQFGVQLPTVLRLEKHLRPSLDRRMPEVRTVFSRFAPVVAARGVVQISTFVHVLMASFLAAGALSTLRFSQMLYLLPISLFGMSVAAAELPELSSSNGDRDQTARRLDVGLARIATFVIPCSMWYLAAGDLIVGALFESGQFTRDDTVAVWVVLGGYSLGLVATTSSRLLQSALYAIGEARIPARTAVVRVAVSLSFGLLLMYQFDRFAVVGSGIDQLGDLPASGPLPVDDRIDEDIIRLGALGLSLGAAIAAWVEYLVLRRSVARLLVPTSLAGGRFAAITAASALSAGATLLARPLVDGLSPLLGAALVFPLAGLVYLGCAGRFGVEAATSALDRLRPNR